MRSPQFVEILVSAIKPVLLSGFVLVMISGCANKPPSSTTNICEIFAEKRGWKKSAQTAERRWGSSVPVMMAIMKQESSFVAKAKPPRTRVLGVPLWRKSSSYGYSQAKDETWRWYEKSVGRNADRDRFSHAIDFIGWYNRQSNKIIGLSVTDTYSLYLAYHEGHGGFRSGSYRSKDWLNKVAAKVRAQADKYANQYKSCD